GRSGGLPRSVGARRAAGARGAGAGAAVSREAGGICAEARGGAELSGDGRRDGRAHPDAQDARASRARSTVARIGGPRMNPIDPRIHQALDGEIARGNLPADLRRAVERLDAAAELLAAAAPAAGLESRVMARRPRPPRRTVRLDVRGGRGALDPGPPGGARGGGQLRPGNLDRDRASRQAMRLVLLVPALLAAPLAAQSVRDRLEGRVPAEAI